MAIPFTCDCGATFKAKDSFAGREVTCRDCGRKLTVPGSGGDGNASAEPAKAAPRVTGAKKPKKKPKSGSAGPGKRNPYEGMTLEERIAARSADTEANRSRIAERRHPAAAGRRDERPAGHRLRRAGLHRPRQDR
jgi:hypothetical protein